MVAGFRIFPTSRYKLKEGRGYPGDAETMTIQSSRSVATDAAEIDPGNLAGFTEVRESSVAGAGLGLFATKRIPRGTVWWRATPVNHIRVPRLTYICLLNSELRRSGSSEAMLASIHKFAYFDPRNNELILCLDNGRFVNHSTMPNSVPANHEVTSASAAAVDIEPGHEIFENYQDYGDADWVLPVPEEFKNFGRTG